MRKISVSVLGLAFGMIGNSIDAHSTPVDWSEATETFKITDHVYYVGTRGLASYLIVSNQQAILLDGTLAENVKPIEDNIEALGFSLNDVKIILSSHAHYDHVAGIAQLKHDTGATFMAMEQDVPALETGIPEGDTNYGVVRFPAIKVDKTLHDGDVVTLGNLRMTATLTPGHTKGCTTWSLMDTDAGAKRRVIFPCSVSVAGNALVSNKGYPNIVQDFRTSFQRLDAMKADIVLPSHPQVTNLFEQKAGRDDGDINAFVEPGLLQKIVEQSRLAFEKELKLQQN
ncbi:subclass B3 metallo-beta-lactamase [Ochrobactrum vermis]|uniref:Subclass B3 metallo-beta-lactamase n=1 Tax=Ochrobactrum vermis TaxID=1827297 RepID=A0ABU8PF81_9HYPH|nr:subclass B3 metallo-beta-lactamase [Ochrobactrum vermis]